MFHKGHEIELLCLLEIRSAEAGEKVRDTIRTPDQNELLQRTLR